MTPGSALPAPVLDRMTDSDAKSERNLAANIAMHLTLGPTRPTLALLATATSEALTASCVDEVVRSLTTEGHTVLRVHAALQAVSPPGPGSDAVLLVEDAEYAVLSEGWLYEPPIPTLLVLGVEHCAAPALDHVPAMAWHLPPRITRAGSAPDAVEALGGDLLLLLSALGIPSPLSWLAEQTSQDTAAIASRFDGSDAARGKLPGYGPWVRPSLDPGARRSVLATMGAGRIEAAALQVLGLASPVALPVVLALLRGLSRVGRQDVVQRLASPVMAWLGGHAANEADSAAISRALMDVGLLNEARQILLATAGSEAHEAVLQRARLEAVNGSVSAALAALTELSGESDAQWLAVLIEAKSGGIDEAGGVPGRDMLSAILRRIPGHPGALALAGLRAARAGDRVACSTHLTRAIELLPGSGGLLMACAAARAESGELAGAGEWVDAAIAAERWHPGRRVARARLALREGEAERAKSVVEDEVLALAEGWQPGVALLGTVKAQLGDRDGAADCRDALANTVTGEIAAAAIDAASGGVPAGIARLHTLLGRCPGLRSAQEALIALLERAGREVVVTFESSGGGAALQATAASDQAPTAGWREEKNGDTRVALTTSPAGRALVTVEVGGRPAGGAMVTLFYVLASGRRERRAVTVTDVHGDADVGPAPLFDDFMRGKDGCHVRVVLPPEEAG